MIRVHVTDTAFAPTPRTRPDLVDFKEGMTVRDALPQSFLSKHAEDSITCARGGRETDVHPCRLHEPLLDGDVVLAWPVPEGEYTVPVIGLVLSIISLVLSIVLAPKLPKPRNQEGAEGEPLFTFRSRLRNRRRAGFPIEVTYGRDRVAGTIIEEDIESSVNGDVYKALIALGQGPIHSVGGILVDTPDTTPLSSDLQTLPEGMQINGNPATNFAGVEAWVRRGTLQQTSIPAFRESVTNQGISFDLLQQETASSFNQTIPVDPDSSVADNDTVFLNYGQVLDVTDEVDFLTNVITFPIGLFTVANGGAIATSQFGYVARYRELDGANNPITTGGPDGDGYVRLPKAAFLTTATQSLFAVEYRHQMIDPQTYTRPTIGNRVDMDTQGESLETVAALSIPAKWTTAGAFVDEMTVSFWNWGLFNFYTQGTPATQDFQLVEWGRNVSIDVIPHLSNNSRRRLRILVGDPNNLPTSNQLTFTTGDIIFGSDIGGPPVGFSHYAVTIRQSSILGETEVTVYQNGIQVFQQTQFGAPPPVVAGEKLRIADAAYYVPASPAGKQTFIGSYDDAAIFSRVLTFSEIQGLYNNGAGVAVTKDTAGFGSTEGLFGSWTFDSAGPGLVDQSAFGNNLQTVGAVVVGTNPGVVTGLPGGTPKRSKYRMEVARYNEKSTNAVTADNSQWTRVKKILDEEFQHPGLALIGVRVPASEQLNTSTPTTTNIVKGRLVPHWDGADVEFPTFENKWTRNPAWACLDMAMNQDYGLGFVFKNRRIIVEQFKALADYADQTVPDNKGNTQTSQGAGAQIAIINYDSNIANGTDPETGEFRGVIFVNLGNNSAPDHWEPGHFVAFSGVPTPPTPNVNVDINESATGSFEIKRILALGPSTGVELWYDRVAQGNPWGPPNDLATVLGNPLSNYPIEMKGRERRFQFDYTFLQDVGGWEALKLILASARAIPIRAGTMLGTVFDAPQSPVGFIGQSSMVEGTFEVDYGGPKQRPNFITMEIANERNGYELDYPSLPASSNLGGGNTITETVKLDGVVRVSGALREIKYRLNQNEKIKKAVRFTASTDSFPVAIGDVYNLAHDLPGWGQSGRIDSHDSGTSVRLDRKVILAAATTYEIQVRQSDTGIYETTAVTQAAGTYTAGTGISITAFGSGYEPVQHDTFSIFVQGQAPTVKVTSIKSNQDLTREIRAVQYDATVYSDDPGETAAIPATAGTATPPISDATAPRAVKNFSAKELAVRTANGTTSNVIAVSWDHDETTRRVVAETLIWVQYGEAEPESLYRVQGKGRSAQFTIRPPAEGEVLRCWAQPISYANARLPLSGCASFQITSQQAESAPKLPTSSGMKSQGGGLVTYSVEPAEVGVFHEVRFGGWLLSPTAYEHPVSATLAVTDGVATDNYVRNVSTDGAQAVETSEVGFSPKFVTRPKSRTGFYGPGNAKWSNIGIEDVYSQVSYSPADFAFEQNGGPSWGGTILGWHVTSDELGSYIEWPSGSGFLLGRWMSPRIDPAGTAKAFKRKMRVEIYPEWDMVYPLAIDDWPALESPDFQRFSLEGPTRVLAGELPNCVTGIRLRVYENDLTTFTQPFYAPGIYEFAALQVVVTGQRINTDYNMRIRKLHVRLFDIAAETEQDATYTYNGSGQLTKIAFADGSETVYTYNGSGQVQTEAKKGFVKTFAYNGSGQITSETVDYTA